MKSGASAYMKNFYCDRLAQRCVEMGAEFYDVFERCMKRNYTETFIADNVIISFHHNQVFINNDSFEHALELDTWFCDGRPPLSGFRVYDPLRSFHKVHAIGSEVGAVAGYALYKSGLLEGAMKLPVVRKVLAPVTIAVGVIAAIDRGDAGGVIDEIVSGGFCFILGGCNEAF